MRRQIREVNTFAVVFKRDFEMEDIKLLLNRYTERFRPKYAAVSSGIEGFEGFR